jgi:hypothetical protein
VGLASGSSAGYARTVALNTKGSRPLVVDGVAYRWNVRRKPSYGQLLGESNLVFAVQRSDVSGQVLVVDTGQVRSDAALGADENAAVTPSRVVSAIRSALVAGWTPDKPGSPFLATSPEP